jgi:hypothetical protein
MRAREGGSTERSEGMEDGEQESSCYFLSLVQCELQNLLFTDRAIGCVTYIYAGTDPGTDPMNKHLGAGWVRRCTLYYLHILVCLSSKAQGCHQNGQ